VKCDQQNYLKHAKISHACVIGFSTLLAEDVADLTAPLGALSVHPNEELKIET
jgi:hypothetical protein